MHYYTLVGSRSTPLESMNILSEVVVDYLAGNGFVGRSGGAEGADTALEFQLRESSGCKEIYLPWDKFNNRVHDGIEYINAQTLPTYHQAMKIAEEVHPAWDKCSVGARRLHARNIYQVLGKDLVTPSNLLVCWAKPTGKTTVSGGTNTAVQLAHRYNIPVVNIYGMDAREALEAVVTTLTDY